MHRGFQLSVKQLPIIAITDQINQGKHHELSLVTRCAHLAQHTSNNRKLSQIIFHGILGCGKVGPSTSDVYYMVRYYIFDCSRIRNNLSPEARVGRVLAPRLNYRKKIRAYHNSVAPISKTQPGTYF